MNRPYFASRNQTRRASRAESATAVCARASARGATNEATESSAPPTTCARDARCLIIDSSSGSVARVLRPALVDIELVLRNRRPHVGPLPSGLRHRVGADHLRVEAPALEVEQPLRFERELPAPLLPHGIAELLLCQAGERRQSSASP